MRKQITYTNTISETTVLPLGETGVQQVDHHFYWLQLPNAEFTAVKCRSGTEDCTDDIETNAKAIYIYVNIQYSGY